MQRDFKLYPVQSLNQKQKMGLVWANFYDNELKSYVVQMLICGVFIFVFLVAR